MLNALKRPAGILVLLLGLVSAAQAQQFNGTLRGVVNDSTGAVLPGASVSVTDVATNDTRSVTTDAAGAGCCPT